MSPRMKSNLELVQENLENRLNSLNDKIDTNNENLADRIEVNNKNILELLGFIKEQIVTVDGKVSYTNGKVNKADEDIRDLYRKQDQYYNNCPYVGQLTKRLEKVESDGFVLQIWNRYPKQTLLAIVVSALLFIGTIGYGVYQVREALMHIQTEQTIQNDKTG